MSKIITDFLVSRFVKNESGTAECPFCGHVMHRHKIANESINILSLCEQCKAPCFGIISLQKTPIDQRTIVVPKKEEHIGAPIDTRNTTLTS
jgi:poly-beta-hydroxyalkanoate depolymerase